MDSTFITESPGNPQFFSINKSVDGKVLSISPINENQLLVGTDGLGLLRLTASMVRLLIFHLKGELEKMPTWSKAFIAIKMVCFGWGIGGLA